LDNGDDVVRPEASHVVSFFKDSPTHGLLPFRLRGLWKFVTRTVTRTRQRVVDTRLVSRQADIDVERRVDHSPAVANANDPDKAQHLALDARYGWPYCAGGNGQGIVGIDGQTGEDGLGWGPSGDWRVRKMTGANG
jgi:hypothetical protein